MPKDKKEIVKRLAEKFVSLPDSDKTFVAGYMAGKEEERAKWEHKEQIATTV